LHKEKTNISLKMNEPKHLDLFSGIGGFALAARWAGFKTVGFCDNEPYAQAVIRKHWPDVPVHGDIRTLRGDLYAGVSILTGGFPCQPFSVAGKQRGKDDDRYLWPEMLRVIKEARPTWIVGENVANIVGMALDQVHIDLEAEGYEVESLIIPACGVDAPHRRNRVWIIARAESLADSKNTEWRPRLLGESDKTIWASRDNELAGSRKNVADCIGEGLEGHARNEREGEGREKSDGSIGEESLSARENVADTEGEQSSSNNHRGKQREACESQQSQFGGSDCWRLRESNWTIEPELGRVAHGIPNRVDRLKGLGNAIVPQVAYQILKGIKELL
jgi:DNA (cytosine-5)-methyltransferase 1